MSIRRRMTVTMVGTLLVLLGAAGVAHYVYTRNALVSQFDETLLAKGRSMAVLLHQSDKGKVEFDFSDNAMPEFGASKSPEYFQLWSADGTTIERSESLKKSELLPWDPVKSEPTFADLRLPDGRNGRFVLLRVQSTSEQGNHESGNNGARGSPRQTYVLAIARDRTSLNRALTTIGLAGIGGMGVLALAFGVLVPWLIGRNLRPLNTIAGQAGQIDANALGTRFPVESMPEELRPICTRLNDSLQRLQGAFERERRFSGDVAHELRTPIAELRTVTETALRFPEEKEEAARSFSDALEIAKQMEAIVENLLVMVAGGTEIPSEMMQPTNVAETMRKAWRANEKVAAGKNISLQLDADGNSSVLSDPTILGQVVSNLLSNAVEYSPSNTTIEARHVVLEGRTLLTISNPTTNLDKADLEHLAEPFWRKDASRTGGKHAGLGLALVACYAMRLRISLKYLIPQQGVFQVSLEFPR